MRRYCGSGSMATAKYVHMLDHNLWAEIDPTKSSCELNLNRPSRIRRKREVKPRKKKESMAENQPVGIPIRNKQFSFTSFLIPICVTGERKDYQFLYCFCALRNALKILSTTMRKEGFAQLYMVGMKSEVNWEKVKSNEVTFTDVITDFLIKSGSVCMVAANGTETLTKVNNRDAPFIVIITATDIHLPCLENLCVGTSWLIFRRTEESRDVLLDREVYRSGRKPITAGVLVNGCVTTITVGFKWVGGIHHFIFDTRYGDFILLHDECYLRQSGNILSLNEGLFYKFKKCVQDWLMEKKRSEEGYLSRYTGGWLTDGYRILRSGGLLLSPKDSECNRGRVKILFKALPLAYLAEKAGAKATNGRVLITKAPRSANNIFTSLVLGSIANVDSFMEINKDASVSTRFFYAGDSEETSTDLE